MRDTHAFWAVLVGIMIEMRLASDILILEAEFGADPASPETG